MADRKLIIRFDVVDEAFIDAFEKRFPGSDKKRPSDELKSFLYAQFELPEPVDTKELERAIQAEERAIEKANELREKARIQKEQQEQKLAASKKASESNTQTATIEVDKTKQGNSKSTPTQSKSTDTKPANRQAHSSK